MLDLIGLISALRRPRLLVSAARFGLDEYRREAHLGRLLGHAGVVRNGEAIVRLLDVEAELEGQRRSQAADYSPARHVSVLTALLGEARLVRAARRPEGERAEMAAVPALEPELA